MERLQLLSSMSRTALNGELRLRRKESKALRKEAEAEARDAEHRFKAALAAVTPPLRRVVGRIETRTLLEMVAGMTTTAQEVYLRFQPGCEQVKVNSLWFGPFSRPRNFFLSTRTAAILRDVLGMKPPVLPFSVLKCLPQPPDPNLLLAHLDDCRATFHCVTGSNRREDIDGLVNTLLDDSSSAAETEAAAAAFLKCNIVFDLELGKCRHLSLQEQAAALHHRPEMLLLDRLSSAESHSLVGLSVDTAVLAYAMLAMVYDMKVQGIDLQVIPLRVCSMFDGISTVSEALFALIQAGYLQHVALLAYDKSDVCAAAATANYSSMSAKLRPGTSLAFRYETRDIRCVLLLAPSSLRSLSCLLRTLERDEYYADCMQHLKGRPHWLFQSPPCGDLSGLNAFAPGVYGPVGNLCFECFRLIEATHRMP